MRTPWRKAHIVEFVFLVIGIACVGWFLFHLADSEIYQSYENYRLDASLRGESATITGYFRHFLSGAGGDEQARSRETPPSQDKAPEAPPERRKPLEPGSMIGRLEIPRIKVSSIVREGSDDKTLKRAAGHVPYTALPGDTGNVGIAAHRDSFFRNLRNVREGDTIRITTTNGVYEYSVDSTKIVQPENIEVLNATPTPSLTLVTCYPFNYVGSAPKRFIVRAQQVNPPPSRLNRKVAQTKNSNSARTRM
jgi:sortase A